MNKRVIIYTRVSTKEQNPEMQLIDLRNYVKARGLVLIEEFSDIASGSKSDRVNYLKMLDYIKKRKTDIVLVWRFDRISRSVKDLVNLLEEFQSLGIDFISYNENIDTSTPAGKVIFTIISAFTEFERQIIRERVIAGLEKARQKGIILGRKPISENIICEVKKLKAKGIHYKIIIQKVSISRAKYFQRIRMAK
jgi:DNA invertase Pin-like site-specific DNA recombinase